MLTAQSISTTLVSQVKEQQEQQHRHQQHLQEIITQNSLQQEQIKNQLDQQHQHVQHLTCLTDTKTTTAPARKK